MRLRITIGRIVPPTPDPAAIKPYTCALFSQTKMYEVMIKGRTKYLQVLTVIRSDRE